MFTAHYTIGTIKFIFKVYTAPEMITETQRHIIEINHLSIFSLSIYTGTGDELECEMHPQTNF